MAISVVYAQDRPAEKITSDRAIELASSAAIGALAGYVTSEYLKKDIDKFEHAVVFVNGRKYQCPIEVVKNGKEEQLVIKC